MSFLARHPILRLFASPQHLWRTMSLGLKSIWLNKLRSFLTALGVIFGVASVIAMLAIGEGASHEAQEQIRRLGSQNIILESVKPPDGQGSAAETRSMVIDYGLTLRDVQQIRQTVPGIEVVVPSRVLTENIWNFERSVDGQIIGALPIYPEMRNRPMLSGRFFSDLEMNEKLPVCAINETAAHELFPLSTPVGKSIRVKGYYYKVLGVIQNEGARVGGEDSPTGSAGSQMFIPYATLMDQYGETFFRYRSGGFEAEKVEFHEAVVRVVDVNQVESRAEAIRQILRTNHKKEDWRIIVPVELLRQAERTKQIFSIVLGSIAAISLVVGGIGIMNIMLASVTERTREIGIRRAMGARQADIVVQFLIETVLLSGAGGIMGVILGISIPIAVQHFAGVTTVVKFWSPALAFLISVFTGIAFGIYPARRAARMNPVEALRHE
ncbi:ABC transporter permease [Brevifollis gellanilyticus]|uniref:ABC transporter substrate-binding protein n=1 Tax=Brevifollis gellanilyticus TaxID=748831 RepID=A0A512MIT3_9BACT|nr:ABC transporter permease [Brevifollis gellanilyticus]GEP46221.1 ABC transporter substrate-binding protein [Brevifollis gellanilyticus]